MKIKQLGEDAHKNAEEKLNKCSLCKGSGWVFMGYDYHLDFVEHKEPCGLCDQTGVDLSKENTERNIK